jgi:hypothetical protein
LEKEEGIMNLSLSRKFFPNALFFFKDKAGKRKKFWERNFICLSCDDEVPMHYLDEKTMQQTHLGVVHGICKMCSYLWKQGGKYAHAH